MADWLKLTRPQADAGEDAVAAYRRQQAAALIELGVDHGDEYVVMKRPPAPSAEVAAPALGPFSKESRTSRAAALDNFPRSGTQRFRVVMAIGHHQQVGRTRDELAEELRLGDSSVDARVWELLQGALAVESELTRATRQGSQAKAVKLTARGLEEFHKLVESDRSEAA